MEFTAVGQLVFPLAGEERRSTTVGTKDGHRFAVWFKDRTNGFTTYGGYRVIRPQAVEDGPLSPAENRLPVAVEAGLKELPSVKGH